MIRLSTTLLQPRATGEGYTDVKVFNENTLEHYRSPDFKLAEKSYPARMRRPLLLAPQISPCEVDSRSFENSLESSIRFEQSLFVSRGSGPLDFSSPSLNWHPLENLAVVARARARDIVSRPSPHILSRVFDFQSDPPTRDEGLAFPKPMTNHVFASGYMRDGTFDISKPVKVEHEPHMLHPLEEDTSNNASIDQWARLKDLAWVKSTTDCSGPLAGVFDFTLPTLSDEDILMRVWDAEMNKPSLEKKAGLLSRLADIGSRYSWHKFAFKNRGELETISGSEKSLAYSPSSGGSVEIYQDLDDYYLELHS